MTRRWQDWRRAIALGWRLYRRARRNRTTFEHELRIEIARLNVLVDEAISDLLFPPSRTRT